MTPQDAPKSVAEMMADIMGNVGNLVRNEVALARAEVAQSLGKAGGALGIMAIAFLLAMTGLNVLAVALVTVAIRFGLPLHWAPVAVGGGLLILAVLLFLIAKSTFTQIGFVPTRAARNFQRDTAAIKDAYNDN